MNERHVVWLEQSQTKCFTRAREKHKTIPDLRSSYMPDDAGFLCYRPAVFFRHLRLIAVRDNSVGIVTHYGLCGLGIETRCGRDFPSQSGTAFGPIQPTI